MSQQEAPMPERAPGASLPQWVHHHAATDPDRVFVQDVQGGDLTYGAAAAAAGRWARAAQAAGLGHGSPVAVMVPTGLTFVEILLGLSQLRAIPVPINTDFKG